MIRPALQALLYFGLLFALAPLLGRYMKRVYSGESTWLAMPGGYIERFLYRWSGIDPDQDQNWKQYCTSLLLFNVLGLIFLYVLLSIQGILPLNPEHFSGLPAPLGFNTAISFVTNTNWQVYSGERVMSYLSQMVGLAGQNFLSAATGMCVAVAVTRGLSRRSTGRLGNFYVDLTRSILYIILPLSIVVAILLLSQGVIDNFSQYLHFTTLSHGAQTLPQGPVASQTAIMELGTNGGGFFNANGAHPFENPTPISNFVEMIAILLIPASFVFTFGEMVGDKRHGRAIFAAMAILLVAGWIGIYHAERVGNGELTHLQVAAAHGNMEGKEVRFGITDSTLWTEATTAASNGSVNSMLDSYTPVGGLIALSNIMTGEVVFGGVGAGLYGMLMYVVLTVFLAGLMVGRTPEYMGKKIGSREVTFALISFLIVPIVVLGLGAFSAVLPVGAASVANPGPHGLSEILYAYSSAVGNNGSAFAGFNGATSFQESMLGVAMFFGRYIPIIAMLALAGSMSRKKAVEASSGTLPTHGPLFVILLIGVIFIMGALTFFPVLSLGPIAEQFAMLHHITFG